jgi:thiol-disulfide isomerase/thioredoxin
VTIDRDANTMNLPSRTISSKQKSLARLAAAVILTALLAAPFWSAGCGSKSSSNKSAPKTSVTTTPERFVLKDIYKKNHSWSDFQGHPFIINFWATWCGPCRREIPDMIKVYNDYHSRGLEIIAISVDDARTVNRVPAFIDHYKIPWLVLYGNQTVYREFHLGTSIPTTLFFDAQGNEVSRFVGAQPEVVFRRELKKLFSQSPSI